MRLFFVTCIGAAAIFFDYRRQKIPNFLIVSGLILGVSWQWSANGGWGIVDFVSGIAIPFLILSPLHYFRMLGAGDIKLLMVFGGFLNGWLGLKCVCISFLIAGAVAAAILFKHRILKRRLNYFVHYLQDYDQNRTWKPYICGMEEDAYLHFSLPALLSCIGLMGGIF